MSELFSALVCSSPSDLERQKARAVCCGHGVFQLDIMLIMLVTMCRYFEDVANPQGSCTTFEDKAQGICYESANRPNLFRTHGAVVGGPKTATDAGDPDRIPYSDEGWNDWRTDYIGSEQALDYNAGLTVALAAAIELPSDFWTSPCGGAILARLPLDQLPADPLLLLLLLLLLLHVIRQKLQTKPLSWMHKRFLPQCQQLAGSALQGRKQTLV